MNRRRLLRLYDIVKNHKDTDGISFEMGTWKRDAGSCGTSACAAGLYVLKSKQKDLRLRYVDWSGQYELINKDDDNSIVALMKHFGLNKATVMLLFFETEATRARFLGNLEKVLEHGNE